MASSLRFGSLVLLAGVPWMLVAGCGDGDVTTFGSAGSSGQDGARAGSGGAHASAGTAGKGGSSSGGTAAGGAAGEGGEPMSVGGAPGGTSGGTGGASGGTGGAFGGTGGASGGTGGSGGGSVGSAGIGATSGAPDGTAGALDETAGAGGAADNVLKNCAYQCATDDDCKIDGEDPQSHFCNPIRHHCEDLSVCETQSDCVAFTSSWYGKCTDDTGCFPGDTCVAFGGAGVCATPPDPDFGCMFAPNSDAVSTEVARFGGASTVEVCAVPASDGICVDKVCQNHCAGALGGCGVTGKVCNNDTGLCDCSASTQCSTTATTPVCGASSHCECTTNDQCAQDPDSGLDKCYSGKCGCASAAACHSQFHNATPVCE